MESFSEDSFAWTDTSSDSLNISFNCFKDAVEIYLNSFKKTDLNNHHTMKCKEKKTFLENPKDEELKINIKEENYDMKNSHKKKKVKFEPGSDNDLSKRKEKVNDFELNGKKYESQKSMSYDETYLDMKVKQEESTLSSSTKKKKSKKKRQSSIDSDISTISTEFKGSIHNALNNSSDLNQSSEPETESATGKTKPKKKKKKSKEIYHDSEDDIEDKIDIGETTICKQDIFNKTQDKHSKVNNSLVRKSHSIEDESDESGCNEISAIKCDNDITHTISFFDKSTTGKISNDSLSEKTLSSHLKQAPNKVPETISLNVTKSTKQRTPRLSERILFEDEDDDNMESSPLPDIDFSSNKNMKKTKQFLKGNPNLRLVTEQFYDSSNLTQDDEIWILKCPKEIEIKGFVGKNINIHGKCKIKFDGQSYDGSAEEDIQSNTLTVLTMEHNKYQIKNLPLNGIISIRKRIPKTHFKDDNVMVNNHTNFIPLPETKCRHPLFGSNYKKALKIPASIAERLNVQDSIEATMKSEKRKKKKHNLDKNTIEQDNQEEDVIMKTEPNLTTNVGERKKKKKRKITDDDPTPKNVKRIKHDPESAEAWESEKAIEENLFNY